MISTTKRFFLFNFLLFTTIDALDSRFKVNRCERITIPMCEDMPYNTTRMPNILGHNDQAEAAIRIHEFIPLIEIGCSKHLKFFLCSLYAPMCSEQVDIPIPSCQSICEEVKARCLPLLQQVNFGWPSMLNCSRLPAPERNGLCMEFPQHLNNDRKKTNTSGQSSQNIRDNWEAMINAKSKGSLFNHIKSINFDRKLSATRKDAEFDLSYFQFQRELLNNAVSTKVKSSDSDVENERPLTEKSVCPPNFVYSLSKRGAKNESERCVPKCGEDVLFTQKDKNFAKIWMCIWASISFVSTLFTIATFWIDSHRFRYPEKPIAFFSICYCLICIAFLIRIYAGSKFVSCDRDNDGKYAGLTVEGLENSGCIVVFLLLYYFGMAAMMWSIVLTVSWYLVTVKHWTHDEIESKASYFHLTSWAIPAVLTIVVLTLRHVDGDEFTGLCFVGYQEPKALLYFVITPLAMGTSIAAFISMNGYVLHYCRCFSSLVKNATNQSSKDNSRIGLFAVVYILVSITTIACYVYEYTQWQSWRTITTKRALNCRTNNTDSNCTLLESIPLKEVFVLKVFLILILATFASVNVWNAKTWNSWSLFCGSVFRRRQRRNFKHSSSIAVRHHSYVHIGPTGVTERIASSCSVPSQINRLSSSMYPYASIKAHRTRRSHHKHLNDITQL